LSKLVDVILVVGAKNSSNSNRLREIGEEAGTPSYLIADGSELDPTWFRNAETVGITAGASAPEVIVEEIMGAFAERYELHVETVSAAEENEFFPLPRSLRPDAA
jgi:4-hydroxy-3-methylbut-2-enyl diphosphate reductase